jgi:hypothetical protein
VLQTQATPAPVASIEARASERRRVAIRALVREAGSCRVDIDVIDLSATGFRFESVYSFAIGARVFLSVPTLSAMEAVIAWRKGSTFGVRLVRPLHRSVFEMLADRYG